MARRAQANASVSLDPEVAVALWRDVRRWPSFVEGFARMVSVAPDWPAEGAKAVWESGPGGRGRVTEKVVEAAPGVFCTRVAEERLYGTQSFRAEPEGEGARVQVALEYELTSESPFAALTDALFIRRALRDSLARTLHAYAVEAEDEAGLR